MPDSTAEPNKTVSLGDQPADKDTLGFAPYVIAIAEFLTHPETKAPLTLSIEGEWGSGKSSFMKQLEKQIIKKSEEVKQEQVKKSNVLNIDVIDIVKFLTVMLRLNQKT